MEEGADLRDADLSAADLGAKVLCMCGCVGITDAGIAHLAGIHTLSMIGGASWTGLFWLMDVSR